MWSQPSPGSVKNRQVAIAPLKRNTALMQTQKVTLSFSKSPSNHLDHRGHG